MFPGRATCDQVKSLFETLREEQKVVSNLSKKGFMTFLRNVYLRQFKVRLLMYSERRA